MWQQYAYFITSGIVGASAHYIKKYYIDCETTVGFFRWFGSSNLSATIKVYLTFIAAAITALQAGIIVEGVTPVITILYAGYLTGYSSDTLNADEKKSEQMALDKAYKSGEIDDRRK